MAFCVCVRRADLVSANYRLRGGKVNAGAVTAATSTEPSPQAGTLGGALGQVNVGRWTSLTTARSILTRCSETRTATVVAITAMATTTKTASWAAPISRSSRSRQRRGTLS